MYLFAISLELTWIIILLEFSFGDVGITSCCKTFSDDPRKALNWAVKYFQVIIQILSFLSLLKSFYLL